MGMLQVIRDAIRPFVEVRTVRYSLHAERRAIERFGNVKVLKAVLQKIDSGSFEYHRTNELNGNRVCSATLPGIGKVMFVVDDFDHIVTLWRAR